MFAPYICVKSKSDQSRVYAPNGDAPPGMPEASSNIRTQDLKGVGIMDLRCSRHTLAASIAALTLAGCGASPQSPTGTSAMIPQAAAHPAHANGAKSWMLPEAKGDNLLYISTNFKTYVDSYPQGRLVGEIDQGGFYLCTDKSGNVFLSQYTGGTVGIIEYAHGGTTPIATIQTAGPPWGCSVDPVTGDLAVAIPDVPGIYHGELAIYKNAHGKPRVFDDYPVIEYIFFCRYDASGNLFLDGTPATTARTSPSFREVRKPSRT